jgi:hypothetical protein
VIGDGLCNCTRFINLSLLDLVDDRNGGVFWWIGKLISVFRIGISSCWSSVSEYALVASVFNKSLIADGGGGNDKRSSEVSNDDNDEWNFLVVVVATSW